MFNSHRNLVIASTIGIVSVVCLMLLYRQLALASLIEHQTRSNVALTEVFSNAVWLRYRYLFEADAASARASGTGNLDLQRLDADVRRLMRGSKVVKVKVYDLEGTTVFSSDPAQIGEDKSENAGFLSALAGQAASNITYRNHFDAFEGRLSGINVIASYIPIFRRSATQPEAVFEVYSDVTGLMQQMRRVQWKIVIGVLGSVAIIYALLITAARRIDRAEAYRRQEVARVEALIRYQASHDSLTELPNRTYFQQYLERAIERAQRDGRMLGVLSIDVDRFKLVNDSFGHEAGDELLRLIAARLRYCVRQHDALCRIGDDEFAIVPVGLDYPRGGMDLARAILEIMKEPFFVKSQAIVTTVSIGISVFPDDDVEPEKLVKNADAAMYLAKEAGRNQYRFYTPELNAHAVERLALESELQQALGEDAFVLHYQPRLAVDQVTVVGFEALLRWRREHGQLVPPGEFIPVLEQNGLISEVGQWALREACLQCKAWDAAGLDPVRVSVNVSPLQFREPNFVQQVEDALARTGLEARRLELELTESALLDNPTEAIATMNALKALGVILSLDDFGTGYSSFSYLKLLPVDFVKIDRSFVRDLDESSKDVAIVAAIAGLADSLGIGIVAEGVETVSQAERLIAMDCHELQGFLYCKPVPPAVAEKWVGSAAGRRAMAG